MNRKEMRSSSMTLRRRTANEMKKSVVMELQNAISSEIHLVRIDGWFYVSLCGYLQCRRRGSGS